MVPTSADVDPDEAPELTDAFFAKGEVFRGDRFVRRGRGRPPAGAKAKEAVNIRLSADVLAYFRKGGPGWQTRVNAALESLVANETKAAHSGKTDIRPVGIASGRAARSAVGEKVVTVTVDVASGVVRVDGKRVTEER